MIKQFFDTIGCVCLVDDLFVGGGGERKIRERPEGQLTKNDG